MNLQGIAIATCLTGLAVTAASVWVIDDHYQRTLRRELEETTGQVGGLRVQAEALQREQTERRRELDAVRTQIADAEAALTTAQAKAEDSKCQALHARIDAVVTLRQVQCYQQLADHAGCLATRERNRADNTMLGVVLGAGAAIVTGGSSLLLTAGGGLAGASMGGSRQCPEPACVLDHRKLRRRVLKDHGLRNLPTCATEYEPAFLEESVVSRELDGFGGLDERGEFEEHGEFDELDELAHDERPVDARRRLVTRRDRHRSQGPR